MQKQKGEPFWDWFQADLNILPYSFDNRKVKQLCGPFPDRFQLAVRSEGLIKEHPNFSLLNTFSIRIALILH